MLLDLFQEFQKKKKMGFAANWITLLLVSGESFSWFIYLIRQIKRNLLICITLVVITKWINNSSVNSA